jgi:hypothetical protein
VINSLTYSQRAKTQSAFIKKPNNPKGVATPAKILCKHEFDAVNPRSCQVAGCRALHQDDVAKLIEKPLDRLEEGWLG